MTERNDPKIFMNGVDFGVSVFLARAETMLFISRNQNWADLEHVREIDKLLSEFRIGQMDTDELGSFAQKHGKEVIALIDHILENLVAAPAKGTLSSLEELKENFIIFLQIFSQP